MQYNKKIFLNSEGDKYYLRNSNKTSLKSLKLKLKIVSNIINIKKKKSSINFLEVGSSNSSLLKVLKKKFKSVDFFALDPSKKALHELKKHNINVVRSTADDLSFFSNNSIDIIFYGFCLYLTDKKDSRKISSEANRVLKRKGVLIIYDFYSEKKLLLPYSHHHQIKITKMDFSNIFDKKNFFCKYKKIYDYETLLPKINNNKSSIAIIILKKK